jgi:UDP-2,4-diacetamido-2,4,6-trideoxy-beta-L-altropyranose hydrolase
MRTYIRTDSSADIGSGHVRRCLTIAEALRIKGIESKFICRNHSGNLIDQIQSAGFYVELLPELNTKPHPFSSIPDEQPEKWLGTSWEIDAAETVQAIKQSWADWLIVDHYGIDYRWQNHLRPYCSKIMVIDDLANRKHACDLLLDQNLVADLETRYLNLIPGNCPYLLGPNYAILHPEYGDLHPRTPPRTGPVSKIFVYYGGADQNNLTGKTILAFLDLAPQNVHMDVVLTTKSRYFSEAYKITKSAKNITLHDSAPNLAALIIAADIAFGASGATTWERCCLGLPTYIVTLANNQVPIAAELHKREIIDWIGDSNAVDQILLQTILAKALDRNASYENWSQRCKLVVDGKGTERVVEIMSFDKQTRLKTRLATVKDEELLLQWANDPQVRQNAFNQSPILPNTHRTWFYKRLRGQMDSVIYIITTTSDLPIGQVRFEKVDEEWEIHYSLAAIARGRGLGVGLVNTALQSFSQNRKGIAVHARVKPENIASQKILTKCSFQQIGENLKEHRFRRVL